jgi:hypothetical protein
VALSHLSDLVIQSTSDRFLELSSLIHSKKARPRQSVSGLHSGGKSDARLTRSGDSEIRLISMQGLERISESQATLEDIDSSVLFEFEICSVRDPGNVANFKFSTLAASRAYWSEAPQGRHHASLA